MSATWYTNLYTICNSLYIYLAVAWVDCSSYAKRLLDDIDDNACPEGIDGSDNEDDSDDDNSDWITFTLSLADFPQSFVAPAQKDNPSLMISCCMATAPALSILFDVDDSFYDYCN